MINKLNVMMVIAAFIISGCSATFVPATSDPNEKLNLAYRLVQYDERPLPAERLIRDAMEIYSNNKDSKGLLKAYWTYGIFFQSNAVENLSETYEQHGFLDKSTTFKNRYSKALSLFDKAEEIALELNDFNMLAMLSNNRAMNHYITGNLEKACQEYKIGFERTEIFHSQNPKATFFVSDKGSLSFEEYKQFFTDYLRNSGCR